MSGEIKNNVSELAGKKRMQISDLAREAKISYETAKRLWHDETEAVRFDTMAAICKVLDCQPGDLFEYVKDSGRQ